MTLLIIVLYALITFLMLSIVDLRRIRRRDRTMFRFARLRGDVIKYLMDRMDSISREDLMSAINVISLSSWSISNHDRLYGETFNIKDIRDALLTSKRGVERVDSKIGNVRNKTLKKFHIAFGVILIENIREHIWLFDFKLSISFVSFLYSIIWKRSKKAVQSYFKWFNIKEHQYEMYRNRYHIGSI